MSAPYGTRKATWGVTGFGGSFGGASWQRVSGTLTACKNGSFIDLYFEMPGESKTLRFSMLQDELRDFLGPFGGHGAEARLRVETDVDLAVAMRMYAERSEASTASQNEASAA